MKIIYFTLIAIFALSFSTYAGDLPTLKTKIQVARETLVDLLNGKTDAAQQKKVKDSADEVSSYLSSVTAPKGKEAKLEELKNTWGQFKATRENELVPLILKGNKEKAKTVATGIQKERMDKMMGLIGQMMGGDL